MSIKSERDTTPNYGFVKPKQTDFYNVNDFNENMNKIDGQIKVNADGVKENSTQIKILEGQINNIDVSGDIRQAINERVNADTSKPLSMLISEWINIAKTAILDGISTLTSHVTSQHTTTKAHITAKVDALPQKSVWTDARGAKLDNLNQSLSATQANVINALGKSVMGVKSFGASNNWKLTTTYRPPNNGVQLTQTALAFMGKLFLKPGDTLRGSVSSGTLATGRGGTLSITILRDITHQTLPEPAIGSIHTDVSYTNYIDWASTRVESSVTSVTESTQDIMLLNLEPGWYYVYAKCSAYQITNASTFTFRVGYDEL